MQKSHIIANSSQDIFYRFNISIYKNNADHQFSFMKGVIKTISKYVFFIIKSKFISQYNT